MIIDWVPSVCHLIGSQRSASIVFRVDDEAVPIISAFAA